MLDGLLGRGFSAKCKSSIKVTKTRIDAIRRKRNAMQRFLKKDIADLLANDLEVNAYGRAEGLLLELNLSSCYDFVEQFCGCIQKQLSVMQKKRECPEECREAVSSVVFAAARFADLPELRDLRHLFTERYGSSLECFVNQEFVEKFAPKPPTKEKKLQLMRDVAQEFSIKWDSKDFEQKISNSSASAKDRRKKHASFHDTNVDEHKFLNDNDVVSKRDNDVVSERDNQDMPSRRRHKSDAYKLHNDKEDTGSKRGDRDIGILRRGELADDGYKPPKLKEEMVLEKDNRDVPSHRRRELTDHVYRPHDGKDDSVLERESRDGCRPSNGREDTVLKKENYVPAVNNLKDQRRRSKSIEKIPEEEAESMKPFHRFVPPPYVKSRVGKYGTNSDVRHASLDVKEAPVSPTQNEDISYYRLEMHQTQSDSINYKKEGVEPERTNGHGHGHGKDHHHQDDLVSEAKPKPRSVRRRHSKLPPVHANISDLEGSVDVKSSSSDKKQEDNRNDVDVNNEEENIMDTMLLHYSKKPSTYELSKGRAGLKPPPSHYAAAVDPGESPRIKNRNRSHLISEFGPSARTVSLPPDPTSPEEARGPARATSFQPEILLPSRHVHPRLPEYDDLAGRIAALKGI